MPFDLARIAAALIEDAPDAVLVVDRVGAIVFINDQAERLFGYPRGELLGRAIEILVPEAERAAHVPSREGYAARPARRPMGQYEIQGRHQDGSPIWTSISLSPVEVDGDRLFVAIVRDLRERRAMEERLRYLSTHDEMTGAANRGRFDEQLARLTRGRQFPVSIVIADLDGLKARNDRDGHAAGDALIRAAAALLLASFRAEDVVARLGGDEFGVLLPGVDAAGVGAAIERLRASAPGAGVELSLGGATAATAADLDDALRRADRAMYADKAARRAARG